VVAEVDELSEHVDDRGAVDAFRRTLAALLPALDRLDPAGSRALHGDAHQANVVGASGDLVWLDFEDACRGPIEYDLGAARVLGERR
jgi:Ser/Thr protein kinase RdoA (MazF antagonist)